MEQGEQGGGAPPQEPKGPPPRGSSGQRHVGPSPGAQQAAREQAARAAAAAEERDRRSQAPPAPPPAPGYPPQGYAPQQQQATQPGQQPPDQAGAQQPPAHGSWPTWQARPSQPGYQQPSEPAEQQPPQQQPSEQEDSQPGHQQPPPGYQQQPSQPGYQQPPPGYQQQPSQPGYQQPPPGYPQPPPGYQQWPYPGPQQTPYGYAPVPYGYEAPRAWPSPVAQRRQEVKAAPDEHPKELPWQLAGWWSRVGAQVIDLLIVWIPLAIVLTVLILLADGASNGSGTETTLVVTAIIATFIAWAVHLFYAPLLMKRKGARNGQTWGKQLCNIRVIRADGNPMRFSDAALRQIIYKSFGMLVASTFIPLFPWILNYLWPTWDEQHRALHDLAADTRVVAA